MLSWKSQWTFIRTIFYSNKKEDDNKLICYFFCNKKMKTMMSKLTIIFYGEKKMKKMMN